VTQLPPLSPLSQWPPFPPLPQPPPPEPAAPPPRPRVTLRICAVWILILAAAALMMTSASGFREKIQTEPLPTNPQLDLVCRYGVGTKLLFSGLPGSSAQRWDAMAWQAQEKAVDPLDDFRIIPVIYELTGRDGAIAAARRVRENPSADSQLLSDAGFLLNAYRTQHFDAAQLDQLKSRYGWYGQLAASQIDSSDTADRDAAQSAARLTVITVIAAFILTGAALLAGIVLLVFFIVARSEGKMPPLFAPADPRTSDVLAEGFAVYLCLMAALSIAGPYLPRHHPLLSLLLIVPVGGALIWLRIRGLWGQRLMDAVGWNAGGGFVREMGAGIAGYITGLPIVALGFAFFFFLARFSSVHATHPIEYEITEGGWVRVIVLLLACVFAPITEELMFRGMFLRHLTARWHLILSAIVVSILFAAIHPQGWTAIPVLGAIGFVLAMIRIQRNSLVASMTAHALNNGFMLMILILAAG
jgi:membrane protease YdiL (CAAX protease family)